MTLAAEGCLQCAPNCKSCRTQQALLSPAFIIASLPLGLQPLRPQVWSNQLDRDQNATVCLWAPSCCQAALHIQRSLASHCMSCDSQLMFCSVAAELPFQILSALYCISA